MSKSINTAMVLCLSVSFFFTGALCCFAETLKLDNYGEKFSEIQPEKPWQADLKTSSSLQFEASGWNIVADFDRVGVPTDDAFGSWKNDTFGHLLRDFEFEGLMDSKMYRNSIDDTEFVYLDLRKNDSTLRLARVSGPIKENTSFSAEWLSRSEANSLISLPVSSAKFNIETRLGSLKLYGEFSSSNWNSLSDAPLGRQELISASAALAVPGVVDGTASIPPIATAPSIPLSASGDTLAFEVGAKIPLTPGSESRVSFRRLSGSAADTDSVSEQLGIEGALRLQEGVKLRAGFAKKKSFGGSSESITEDSIWTGIVIQF